MPHSMPKGGQKDDPGAAAWTGRVIAERFELLEKVGQGAMGLVFGARDMKDGGARVAVKVMHPHLDEELALRLRGEAMTLERLAHPGIVGYIAHGRFEGLAYLVMEWLEGEDLAAWLRREGALAVPCALELMERICVPLAYAHSVGMVHRDVKPANVFITGGDLRHVKLLDFGIARFADAASQTQVGVALGTPHYMSPEQARGLSTVDARADVYALGAMLFELLTGRPPFVGEHGLAVLMMALFDEPPTINQLRGRGRAVSERLEQLVQRMLSKDPLRRPRDAGAVVSELGALGSAEGASSERPGSVTRPNALTTDELRIVSVVAAAGPALAVTRKLSVADVSGEATPGALTSELMARVRDTVASYGARLERLADGTLVAMVASGGLATEQAVCAARCALAMREVRPDVPMIVATGRTQSSRAGAQPVGEVIERAVGALFATAAGSIQIDDVTAGLLPRRFEVTSDGSRMMLRGETDPIVTVRTVLGKPTPCVGRRRELARLTAVFDDCVDERAPAAVLVLGPSGIGKTRLCVEFVERMRQRHGADSAFELLYGRAESLGGAGAYAVIADALRRFVGVRRSDPVEVQRHRVMTRIGRHLLPSARRRVVMFIGEAIGVPFADEGEIELVAARRDGRLMADQVRSSFLTWLRGETRELPLILLLEDIQWGDRPSLGLIDAALKLEDAPLLVVAASRPELEERLPELWGGRDRTRIALGPLKPKASRRLVEYVLGDEGTSAVDVSELVGRADGNAFFLEELIRAQAQSGGTRGATPDTVLGMIESRLARLRPLSRLVLRAASVYGDTFEADGVQELCGMALSPKGLRDELDELLGQELLLRRDGAQAGDSGQLRFRSAGLREAVYAMLTPRDRQLGHNLAGEFLSLRDRGDALARAQHFMRSDAPGKALPHFARAAKVALEANDLQAASERAAQGVDCGAEGALLGELLLIRSEATLFDGDLDASARHAQGVIDHCPPASAEWFRALGYAVFATSVAGREDDLERWVDMLYATPSSEPEVALPHVIALLQAVAALNQRGRYQDAEAIIILAEKRSQLVSDAERPALTGRMEGVRGLLALSEGDLAAASDHYRRSVEAYARCGNQRRACNMQISLAFSNMRMGFYEEADADLDEALRRAEAMGLGHVSAVARHNLGLTRALAGRVTAGMKLESDARRALVLEGDVRVAGVARIYMARIKALGGDWDGAEREARAAVEELAAFAPALALAQAVLAQALLELERPEEALKLARAAHRVLESLGNMEEGEGLIYLALARALIASAELPEARAVLARGVSVVTAQSLKISDLERRRRYLEGVDEHRRLIELAASVGQ